LEIGGAMSHHSATNRLIERLTNENADLRTKLLVYEAQRCEACWYHEPGASTPLNHYCALDDTLKPLDHGCRAYRPKEKP
jgi:hypothetical protein